jgi:hypothetical protein
MPAIEGTANIDRGHGGWPPRRSYRVPAEIANRTPLGDTGANKRCWKSGGDNKAAMVFHRLGNRFLAVDRKTL